MSGIVDASGSVRLTLVEGDAFAHDADLAIIGTGPGLRARLEDAAGARFHRLDYPESLRRKYHPLELDGLRVSQVLWSPRGPWKCVLAIPTRPGRRVRRRFIEEVLEAMQVFARRELPARVLLLPLRPDPPEVVACTMLLLAWCVARKQPGGRAFPRLAQVALGVGDEAALFRRLVETDAGIAEYRAFHEELASRTWLLDADALRRVDRPFAIAAPG